MIVYTAGAVLVAAILVVGIRRQDERSRLAAWRGALAVTGVAVACALAGAASGNLALFYGGGIVTLVGGIVSLALTLAVYNTGDEYWISGVKRNREDRHWAGSGPVEIDDDAREEYETLVGD